MGIRSSLAALFDAGEGTTSLNLRDASPLNNPAIPLGSNVGVSLALSGLGGMPTASGEVVSERNAMANPTVRRCITLIAEGVAAIPFKIYLKQGKAKTEATDHSLSYLLSTEPNPEMGAFTFIECLAGCVALTGNGYAWIERTDKGQVIGLWPLHPLLTEPKRNGNCQIYYETADGMPVGKTRIIAAADIIHLKMWSMDGLKGESPVASQRQEIGLSNAIAKSGAQVFGNGISTSGFITPRDEINAEQMQQTREMLERQVSGTNRGRVGFLPFGFDFKQVSLSLSDAQFVELRNMSRSMICAIWGVDPHFCGSETRQASANHEQATLSLIQDTLQPYLLKIEQEFRRKLLPPTARTPSQYDFGFDVSARLRTDIKTTLDAVAVARQWSLMTIDEARAALGMNPVGGDTGKILLSPVNMIDATKVPDWNPAQKGTSPAPKEKDEQDPNDPGK